MEDMVNITPSFWKNRSVLITGHTGFKGSWLSIWLNLLGAKVHGYALDTTAKPNMFEVAGVESLLASDTRADLADAARLKLICSQARPEIIFHLAAQALVREGYRDPLGTLSSNVMGTAHVLDAVRFSESVRAVVVITTDKVYENRELGYPYRELDRLGGHDPYSASKAAAEIVTAAYRESFFSGKGILSPRVATARAGNVIGGGDWGVDRLVPDCLRAFAAGDQVRLRFPTAVRPWQHVLESLAGYLLLAERLMDSDGATVARAWNFGPDSGCDAEVKTVAEILAGFWGEGARIEIDAGNDHPHEAGLLRLDSTLSRDELGWRSRWSLQQALAQTADWHKAWLRGADMGLVSREQILAYSGKET